MSDAARWDQIYRDRARRGELPQTAWGLTRFDYLLPSAGRALDLASGVGANSLMLARRGLAVEAWDVSQVALDQLAGRRGDLPITCRQVDIRPGTIPASSFDVIVVCRYLDRLLFDDIAGALVPGGLLVYQTFTRERLDGATGPKNPDYLLAPGELLRAFRTLEPRVHIECGDLGDATKGLRNEALLIATRPRAT